MSDGGDIGGAIIGFVGVIVGGGLTIAKDVAAHWFGRRRAARFAAVRIICVLDQYVEKCVEVVYDDGTVQGRPALRTEHGEYYDPQVVRPEPPIFPDDIDWTSLPAALMHRVLALPNLASETNRFISAVDEHASPPDYIETFQARWEGYAGLGLEALSIAAELRAEYDFPKFSLELGDPNWDARNFLLSRQDEVRQKKQRDRAAHAAMFAAFEARNVAGE